jgi:SAM-dependent MidA family methyltransferase
LPTDDTDLAVKSNPRFAQHTDERRHAALVRQSIAAEIAARGGWMPFEAYMERALYAPGLGYYSAGARKFGAGGDFTTAPEISVLFGGCLARQAAEILRNLDGGSILEIGAGSGKLAADLLKRLASLGRLPERYWILEVSADLKDRQSAYLRAEVPQYFDRVGWLDAPPARSSAGLILANEVLDALPVARYRCRAGMIRELGVSVREPVSVTEPQLYLAERDAGPALSAEVTRIAAHCGVAWPEGYLSEVCLRLPAFCREVTSSLARGVVLWFDYGLPRRQYYLAERRQGTLICHYRQQVIDDPLFEPGLADLSAWVDFTSLAEAADSAGFHVAGFTTQAYFLISCGIEAEMQAIAGGEPRPPARLADEAKSLLLPGEMGERFKCMAWTRNYEPALSGFSLADWRHSL